MTVLQNTLKLTAAIALLVVMAAGNAASAAEKLVGTYGEQRTVLAFRVPDTAAQKLLPAEWQASPASTGPSKDANLSVVFVDALTVQNPDGTPGETVRIVALVVPAKRKGTEAVVPMVVGGFASTASYVPGAYANEDLASATIDRHAHTDPTGETKVEESWEFEGNGGDVIGLQMQYDRGVATRSKIEVMPHSGVKPDFYRIYRIEQAADVVRSIATSTDRVQKYAFKATGAKLSPLFNGSEQLVSITSLPFYTRQVFLPEEVSQ